MVDLASSSRDREITYRHKQLTAAAAVWSRWGGGLHSKLAVPAAATVARLWLGAPVAGCHVPVASAGWLLTANAPLWAAVVPAPMNDHDGCCCCWDAWCAVAGDWPRSARWVPERGWHGGSDAELTDHKHSYATLMLPSVLSFINPATLTLLQLITTHHWCAKVDKWRLGLAVAALRTSTKLPHVTPG